MEERVYGQEDLERVEAVLEKVICQAGVDYEYVLPRCNLASFYLH